MWQIWCAECMSRVECRGVCAASDTFAHVWAPCLFFASEPTEGRKNKGTELPRKCFAVKRAVFYRWRTFKRDKPRLHTLRNDQKREWTSYFPFLWSIFIYISRKSKRDFSRSFSNRWPSYFLQKVYFYVLYSFLLSDQKFPDNSSLKNTLPWRKKKKSEKSDMTYQIYYTSLPKSCSLLHL
jgi:hypothetical protein